MNKSEEKLRQDIRSIRHNLGITQKEMGAKMGMTESAYNRIEGGMIAMSYSHLLAISEAFGISVADIILYPDKYNM